MTPFPEFAGIVLEQVTSALRSTGSDNKKYEAAAVERTRLVVDRLCLEHGGYESEVTSRQPGTALDVLEAVRRPEPKDHALVIVTVTLRDPKTKQEKELNLRLKPLLRHWDPEASGAP